MVYVYMYVPIIMLGWEDYKKKRICQQRLRKIRVEFVVFTMRAKIGSVILGHSLERPALSWK